MINWNSKKSKGEWHMSQSNQSNEYNHLFEKYNKLSNEELSKIAKTESGYTELAIKVASDILKSDRTEYYNNLKHEQQVVEEKQKINKDELFINMSRDIHFIKNMLLFFVILTVLGVLFGFYTVFVTIPKLF